MTIISSNKSDPPKPSSSDRIDLLTKMPSDTESCDDFVDAEDFPSFEDTNGSFNDDDSSPTTSKATNSSSSERPPNRDFELHRAIFERRPVNEIHKLLSEKTLKYEKSTEELLGLKDPHGNTPLHLAIMLGMKDTIQLLLTHKAPVKSRNSLGWTSLDEAISYGDRQIIKLVMIHARKQTKKRLNTRRPKLIKALTLMPDFEMTLKWEFHSWLPIVRRYLPSDTCRISKKGSSIRLDTTLIDFSDRNWQRGDITFLFLGHKKSSKALILLDNELKVYQSINYKNPVDIEEDIDLLMSSDIVQPYMSMKSISFQRVQAGWFFSKSNKTEKVGNYQSDFYEIKGMSMISKKRREHLSEEDIKANKALLSMVKKSLDNQRGRTSPESPNGFSSPISNSRNGQGSVGEDESFDSSEEDDVEIFHDVQQMSDECLQLRSRQSIPPPEFPDVTWEEYISAPTNSPPCIGRPWRSKENTKHFKATMAMSEDFPLSIEALLNILEAVAPFKHFDKLRQFVQLKLPPGFPVKIDVPVVPTVMGKVTFVDFNYDIVLSDQLFEVPDDYVEDADRFTEFS